MGRKKKKAQTPGKGKRQEVGKRSQAPSETPAGYAGFLAELKRRIARERVRAVLAANSAMVMLYWEIGRSILESQEKEGWGTKVVDRLSRDLRRAFPDMSGLSARNLIYMRQFAASWQDRSIAQRTAAQLPWRINQALLDKIEDPDLRLWYAEKALEQGLSRNLLVAQIESRLHEREGRAQHNFEETLPPADSDMAAQAFKDPYLLDFLGSAEPRREAELEQKLVDHIQRFLLELGKGFAYVGRQVPLQIGQREFRLDLLFYHLELRCYVIIELLCARAHKRSYVVSRVMWRSSDLACCELPRRSCAIDGRHISSRHRSWRNAIRSGSFRHGFRCSGESTSHIESASAFISRSASA